MRQSLGLGRPVRRMAATTLLLLAVGSLALALTARNTVPPSNVLDTTIQVRLAPHPTMVPGGFNFYPVDAWPIGRGGSGSAPAPAAGAPRPAPGGFDQASAPGPVAPGFSAPATRGGGGMDAAPAPPASGGGERGGASGGPGGSAPTGGGPSGESYSLPGVR